MHWHWWLCCCGIRSHHRWLGEAHLDSSSIFKWNSNCPDDTRTASRNAIALLKLFFRRITRCVCVLQEANNHFRLIRYILIYPFIAGEWHRGSMMHLIALFRFVDITIEILFVFAYLIWWFLFYYDYILMVMWLRSVVCSGFFIDWDKMLWNFIKIEVATPS